MPILVSGGCSDKGDGSEDDNGQEVPQDGAVPIPEGKGRVVGVVTDGGGLAIEGVQMTAGGLSVNTDYAGAFLLDLDPGPQVLRFSKVGYTEASLAVPVTQGAAIPVAEGLLARSAPVAINLDEGGTVGEVARAVVAPGDLANADGTPATGEILAYVTPLDVMGDLVVAPGDFSAVTSAGADTRLETFAMADYNFEDSAGNPLNVALGKTVTVEMDVPAELGASVGDQIPAWSFDSATGKWKEEGMGEVVAAEDGTLMWRAEVAHFSWWNADVPIDERDCVQGTITDCGGNPVSGASVTASGVSYRGESRSYPGCGGAYCVDIKRGGTVDLLVVCTVNGQTVGRRTQVIGANAGASCDQGGAGCAVQDIALPCDPAESDLDCRDSALLPCSACLSGRVVTPTGEPAVNAVVTLDDASSGFRATTVTQADGAFCITAPLNAPVEIRLNAAGYPPTAVTATATVEGQCPACESLGDLMLEAESASGGPIYETCNFGEVEITATDLDGADPSLGSLPYMGMMIIDHDDILSGYLWLSSAEDPENPEGSSIIYLVFEIPTGTATGGSAELEGVGQYNSGGVVGVNSELYAIDGGTLTWNEGMAAAGQTLTGNVAFALNTTCGMAIRTVQYTGTFSTTVLGLMDIVGMSDCLAFTSVIASYGLLEGYGVLTLEADGAPVTLGGGLSMLAAYDPTSNQLDLSAYTDAGISFSLTQNAPIFGTQSISDVTFSNTDGCYYQASDVPEIVIDASQTGEMVDGPVTGGFTAELAAITECQEPTLSLAGTFQAAVCAD